MKLHTLLGATLPFALLACSGDLMQSDDDDDVIIPPGDSLIAVVDNGDDTSTATIDASDEMEWVYMDLETAKEVESTAPEWDLAFRRFRAITNGGINGSAGVEVARLGAIAFDAVTDAPRDGYLEDLVDGDDDGEIEDDAIHVGPSSETGPWAYNPEEHTLSNSGELFVVKSGDGNFFLLAFLEYYDENGESGKVQMRFKQLGGQLPEGVFLASWDRERVYLSIANGVVAVDDETMSTDWDLSARLVGWTTNGNFDRPGSGGAMLAETNDFSAITTAPTVGFAQDETFPYPGPPGAMFDFDGNPVLTDWFDYDMTGHTAEPKDVVFLVRGANGDYGKLRIFAYDEPNKTYQLKLDPVDRRVETYTIEVDATSDWVYWSLRLGAAVEVTDPATESHWDLAFSKTKIRTNSGTSGAGEGGAVESAMALDTIADVPADGYAADADLADPDGGMFSGNDVLSGWWEFDGTSSSTVPRDTSFVVRTADGSAAKLRITGYANDGDYTIDFAYAGPNQTTF
ncbi:MAG: HmuY family protein [Deltaproteobacteria bacterium]